MDRACSKSVSTSPHSEGKLPYWPGSLYKAHLEPAAKEIGIVGWAILARGPQQDVRKRQ